jgi:hypothetical protein
VQLRLRTFPFSEWYLSVRRLESRLSVADLTRLHIMYTVQVRTYTRKCDYRTRTRTRTLSAHVYRRTRSCVPPLGSASIASALRTPHMLLYFYAALHLYCERVRRVASRRVSRLSSPSPSQHATGCRCCPTGGRPPPRRISVAARRPMLVLVLVFVRCRSPRFVGRSARQPGGRLRRPRPPSLNTILCSVAASSSAGCRPSARH